MNLELINRDYEILSIIQNTEHLIDGQITEMLDDIFDLLFKNGDLYEYDNNLIKTLYSTINNNYYNIRMLKETLIYYKNEID